LGSLAPPNISLTTVGSLPPNFNIQNLNRSHLTQGTSGQQRAFVTMVTSSATFGQSPSGQSTLMSSPNPLLSPTSGMFSMPSQFMVPAGTVRGLARPVASQTARSPTVLVPRQVLASRTQQLSSATPAAVPNVLTSPTMMSQFRIQQQQISPAIHPVQQQMSPPGGVLLRQPQQMSAATAAVVGAGFQLQSTRQPTSNITRRPSNLDRL
jgi:energy-coupling factor transporter ATP-binding protein EcfA2